MLQFIDENLRFGDYPRKGVEYANAGGYIGGKLASRILSIKRYERTYLYYPAEGGRGAQSYTMTFPKQGSIGIARNLGQAMATEKVQI
jgi:hypothetical protein